MYIMKPSDPMLLANVTLRWRMYPVGKFDIFQHLAILVILQSDHAVGSPVRTLVHCVMKYSRPPDLKLSSNVSQPFAWVTGPAMDPSWISLVQDWLVAGWIRCQIGCEPDLYCGELVVYWISHVPDWLCVRMVNHQIGREQERSCVGLGVARVGRATNRSIMYCCYCPV